MQEMTARRESTETGGPDVRKPAPAGHRAPVSGSGLQGVPFRAVERGKARILFHEISGERMAVVEPAEGEARATILWIHGLTDHLGRNLQFPVWLARLGYRTVIYEQKGHGGRASDWESSWWLIEAYLASEDPAEVRDRIGIWAASHPEEVRRLDRRHYAELARTHVQDHIGQIDRVLSLMRAAGWDHPEIPLFVAGHSMGALLAIETVWTWSWTAFPNLRGVVLLSPALKPQGNPDDIPQRAVVEGIWSSRGLPFRPARSAMKLILQLNFPVDTSWGENWISDLAAEKALFGDDFLMSKLTPTRYASSIEGQMAVTEQRDGRFPLKGIVFLPGSDGITSVDAGLSFARKVRAVQGDDHLALVQFENVCAHDLLRSSVREETRLRIAEWLDSRLTAER